ncbi:TonB-dependent receptor [Mucilaginibacter sp. PPCGB 2223]|uniref:SusC/RagA family TonB-linked outer membrane protein n=1 Tax=Mucilaginibacter sp. PPCGB 2223 TaxID=1886027 RepID=UPI000AC81DF3|nr:TonB-dependent receptor [Mucilaginibacter sp. PPCGB 2223]
MIENLTKASELNVLRTRPCHLFWRSLIVRTFVLALLLVLSVMATFAQNLRVTGQVRDDKEALAGVTVKIKGSTVAVATDVNGKYSINVPGPSAILVYSFIGYNIKEVQVGSQSVINVILQATRSQLNDVVVVAYGSVKKQDLTGSVGVVNMNDIQKAPVPTLDAALAGRVAGVQVVSGDGQPGANADIIIRGPGSVTQSSAPLYVIDGFPQEDANFNSINPQDVASITVLKDASATALYGSRGANGVIVIATKKGTSPTPTINYNANGGIQQSINNVKLMNAYQFVELQNDINPYWANAAYFSNGKTLADYRNAPTIDWQKLLFNARPAFQNHTLSLSGNTNKTSYIVSANIADQDGLIIKSGFRRYQARIVLDQNVTDKLKVGVNVNYANTKSFGQIPSVQANPTGNGQNLAAFNLMNVIWSYRPVLGSNAGSDPSFYLDQLVDNNINDGGVPGTTSINPLINTQNQVNDRFNTTLTGNTYAEYTFIPGLVLRVTAGLTTINGQVNIFNNSNTASGSPLTAAGQTYGVNGSISRSGAFSFINETTLNYSRNFNKYNHVSALIGHTYQYNSSNSDYFSASNLPNESLGIAGLGQGTPYQINSGASLNALESYLARVNYAYKERYLFTVNFRADGTSKLYADNRWGFFPSGAFAWRISSENFMKKLSWIDDAKLKVSYGVIGNNRVSDFAYQSLLATGSTAFTSFNNVNVNATTVSTLSNYNLKWETTYETDLGSEVSLFKGRLTSDIDYYHRTTKNLLLNANVPYSTGFSTAYENVGSISNEGFELTVSTVNIAKRNFMWSTSFNISFNRNKVLSLANGQNALLTTKSFESAEGQANYIAKVGQPVAQFYGYISDGLYQLNDFYKVPNGTSGFYYVLKENIPYYAGKNTLASPNTNQALVVQPGDPKFKDLNGDGVINASDYTAIGNPYPKHFGGLTNNFTYQNFDLSVFMQWSYGNQIMDANILKFEGGNDAPQSGSSLTANQGGVNKNMWEVYVNRWTPTNPSNYYPRVNANTNGTRQYSTRIIEDGSFIRLKTVSFGYTMDKKIAARLGMKSLRLSLSGQNLLTLSKYTGPDPEVSTASGNNLTPGFDFSPYPRTRVVTLGVNLSL